MTLHNYMYKGKWKKITTIQMVGAYICRFWICDKCICLWTSYCWGIFVNYDFVFYIYIFIYVNCIICNYLPWLWYPNRIVNAPFPPLHPSVIIISDLKWMKSLLHYEALLKQAEKKECPGALTIMKQANIKIYGPYYLLVKW